MTEDEVVGGHHQLVAHEFEKALGVADGQIAKSDMLQSMGSQNVGYD